MNWTNLHDTHVCMHACMYVYACTYMYKHAHAHTCTRAHKHAKTRRIRFEPHEPQANCAEDPERVVGQHHMSDIGSTLQTIEKSPKQENEPQGDGDDDPERVVGQHQPHKHLSCVYACAYACWGRHGHASVRKHAYAHFRRPRLIMAITKYLV